MIHERYLHRGLVRNVEVTLVEDEVKTRNKTFFAALELKELRGVMGYVLSDM